MVNPQDAVASIDSDEQVDEDAKQPEEKSMIEKTTFPDTIPVRNENMNNVMETKGQDGKAEENKEIVQNTNENGVIEVRFFMVLYYCMYVKEIWFVRKILTCILFCFCFVIYRELREIVRWFMGLMKEMKMKTK